MSSQADKEMKFIENATSEFFNTLNTASLKDRLKMRIQIARTGQTFEALASVYNIRDSQKSSYNTRKKLKNFKKQHVDGILEIELREKAGLTFKK